MPDTRPGDNLYATSVIAVDVETGAIKGHHQYHWNDAWDWDEVSPPLLIEYEKDGRTIQGAVHAGRNGYLWELERNADGSIGFVEGKPYVRQDAFEGLDENGRPIYDPDRTPGTNKTVTFCPSLWGGKDWPTEAYSPQTGLFYIPTHENLCSELGGVPMAEREPGELYIGIPIDVILSSLRFHESVDTSKPVPIGQIQAWDLSKGELVWQHEFMDDINWGPLMATAGNLLFAGGTADRKFRAFDATTGEVLWEMPTNSGITGAPSSFMVDGKQYVAVQSGWGVDAERMRGLLEEMLPAGRVPEVPQGGAIWVFAVEDGA
jgi:alcohol dehydrogenase (cytochrome c)